MKKALTGCLVVVLLAIVVGGAAGYWFIVRPAWNAGSAFIDSARQWQQLVELDRSVRNTDAFQAPADGRLSAERLQGFLAVQQAMVDSLGDDWKALDERYRSLKEQHDAGGKQPGFEETVQAFSDLSTLMLAAKQAQVDALNRQGMSLAEYRWMRQQELVALPLALADAAPQNLAGSAMADNAALLRTHRDVLQKTLAANAIGF